MHHDPCMVLFPGESADPEPVIARWSQHRVVMWDIDTNDWPGQTAAQITDAVMGNAHNGP